MVDTFSDIEVYDALVEVYDPVQDPRPDWWDDEDEQDWHDQFRSPDNSDPDDSDRAPAV